MAPRRELARRHAAAKSDETRTALIEAYAPLLARIAANVVGRRAARVMREDNALHDEMLSAAGLALVEAADDWRPEKGLAWSTWLAAKVRWAVASALRSYDDLPRGMRAAGAQMLNLDAVTDDAGALVDEPCPPSADMAEAEEAASLLAASLLADMEEDDLRALTMYFYDHINVPKIAETLGWGRARASRAIKRALGRPELNLRSLKR